MFAFQPDREGDNFDSGRCSYCGSIEPNFFMGVIEQGAEIGPTDKNYKVYVEVPNENPGELIIVGSANFDKQGCHGWVPAEDVVDEIFKRSGSERGTHTKWVQLGLRGPKQTLKFYFQHLSSEQKHKFVQLLNERKLNIGMPGHFYVTPFFITLKETSNGI